MKKIRVLQYISTAEVGGVELRTVDFMKRMDQEQFHLETLFFGGPGQAGKEYEKHFETAYLNAKVGPGAIAVPFRLRRMIVEKKFDIIHAYGFRAVLSARLAAAGFRGCRVITALEGKIPFDTPGRLLFALDKATLALTELILANSRAAVEHLVSLGYPEDKFVYIANGIEVPEQLEYADEETRTRVLDGYGVRRAPEDRIVICVANLRAVKGHKYLLEALCRLAGVCPDFRALLVGEDQDDMGGSLMEKARGAGLGERVFLMGARSVDEVMELLRVSDVFVLASLMEGMPGSILEAMAAGLPVVATDVGGVAELVVDGETGRLVQAARPDEMSQALEKFLADANIRKDFGQKGYNRVKKVFNIDDRTVKIQDVYRELAAGRFS